MSLLSYTIFLPMAGFLAILFIPKERVWAVRWTAAIFSFVPMILSFILTYDYFFNYASSSATAATARTPEATDLRTRGRRMGVEGRRDGWRAVEHQHQRTKLDRSRPADRGGRPAHGRLAAAGGDRHRARQLDEATRREVNAERPHSIREPSGFRA